jgi:hypothetical protein
MEFVIRRIFSFSVNEMGILNIADPVNCSKINPKLHCQELKKKHLKLSEVAEILSLTSDFHRLWFKKFRT